MSLIRYTPQQADLIDYVVANDGIVLVEAGAGCVDKDTEFLTPTGWKPISSYSETDYVAQWNKEGDIQFIKPDNYIKAKASTLNHIKSNTVDMVLSNEHRAPYITDKGTFTVKKFEDIKNFSKLTIPRTYNKITNNLISSTLSNELIRVLVMQSTDGSHIKKVKKFKIKINVKNSVKKERVIELLKDANIPFHLKTKTNNFQTIIYYPPEEIAFKGLSCLWNCNNDQLKVIGEEIKYWSGSNFCFTGNKENSELIQHAWHILSGNYVSMTKNKKEDLYTVRISSRKTSHLTFKSSTNLKLSTITPYKTLDGYKYCFTTPSGFWLARRKGKVFPTGNSGKSFMSRRIVAELTPKSGIYTAFNKAIVEEGRDKFRGTSIECKTFHALAYAYIKPKLPIQTFSYKDVNEKISYTEKRRIIDSLENFFVSSSTCMFDFFEKEFKNHPRKDFMVNLLASYVEKMANNEINPSFNFLLKSLHLMLVEKTVNIKTDIVILDEINDITSVTLEIFKLIDAPKKIGLGESHQAIYQFLKLVNGFEKLKDEATFFKLTRSYRCSEDIAERIQEKFKEELSEDFEFIGTDNPVANGLTLYCTSTNASIVDKINDRLSENKGFTLLRKPSEIFAAPLAVLSASKGKRPYQKHYEYLLDLYEKFKNQTEYKSYFKFLNAELDDEEINNAVKLLLKLNKQNINLYELYKEAKEAKKDKSYTIATVYTSKGLEFETVYIAEDLNSMFNKACSGKVKEEEALTIKRCYYVATSRAGVNLINSVI